MKQQIHPDNGPVVYSCTNCGMQIATESTKQENAKLDVCSNCHPAYTGKVFKDVWGSRIDSFNNRFKRH